MIIGLLTLLMSMFGMGSVEVFYLDKLEEGIKKEIVDKDRRQELQDELKEYSKTSKEFRKVLKGDLKELRQKNLDRNTTMEWYETFYDSRMKERLELQETFIEKRISLQEKITEEEWDAIIKRSLSESEKLKEKEHKKKMKKKDKNAFRVQEKAIIDNVEDQQRRLKLLEALGIFEDLFEEIHDSYDRINVEDSQFLSDKNASVQEMQTLAGLLNVQRTMLYEGNILFLQTMHELANEDEWKPIMKAYNKLLE